MDKNALKAEIVRSGYTQRKLAAEMGMAQSTMIRKLKDASFTINECEAMGKILGFSKSQLGNIFFN